MVEDLKVQKLGKWKRIGLLAGGGTVHILCGLGNGPSNTAPQSEVRSTGEGGFLNFV